MNIPTRNELRAAYRQGEEASIQLFERLIQKLQVQQDRLKKNSKNSSKPPSSDGFKKSGGSKGHKGRVGKEDVFSKLIGLELEVNRCQQ